MTFPIRIGVASAMVVALVFSGLLASSATGAPLPAKINFQPAAAPTPAGYTADTGAAYSDATGYGWVTQSSLASPMHTPLDLTANTRDRDLHPDQRLDTFIHMQYSGSAGVPTPGAWEYSVPAGTYSVTVSVGDAAYTDSNHRISIEGTVAIAGFAPTTTQPFATATVVVSVSDGRLTIDAAGGTNTKLDYVEIAAGSGGDTTPPAAPANVAVTPGDASASLSWTPNTEPDLAGYNVYRSTNLPVPTTTPLNSSPLTSPGYIDNGLSNGTTYHYVVQAVDTTGNKADAEPVSATPFGTAPPALPIKVNFQSETAPVPNGYLRDFGEAYGPRSGADQGSGLSFGWVAPGTTTPRSLVGVGRDRNINADQRLDTFIHMQHATSPPGAWEIGMPNGTYTVNVTVGDAADYFDSTHRIVAEGTVLVAGFPPSPTQHFASGGGSVTVADGRLTLEATGGTNTKIDYVEISAPDSTPPAGPTGVTATPGDTTVSLSWNANSESDLAGYNVYRSTSIPVPTTSPVNSALITSTSFNDTGRTNGTTYYYVVQAVDTSGNKADAAPVSATPTSAGPTNIRVNFQTQGASVPAGYVKDFGEGFGSRTGADQGSGLTYGWVIPGTTTPRTLVGNARERDLNADQRLDTFMHMQYTGGNGVAAPGSWEIALPDGTYSVTVAVGDAGPYYDSSHRMTVEGQTLINGFVPTAAQRHATAQANVTLNDGRLTVDATGGTNTKIDYIEIRDPQVAPPPPPPPSTFTAISWSKVAPIPQVRHESGTAAVDGKLYVFGGYPDPTFAPTARIDRYDAATNTWTRMVDMPQASSHLAVTVDGHDVYLAGGYPGGPGGTQAFAATTVWKYNVDSNTFTSMPPLPQARGAGALGISGRVLHFFGGSDASRVDHAEHWTLSLDGGTAWQTATPLPTPRNHLGVASLNGRIYALGGQQGQDNGQRTTAQVDVWDPFTASWSTVAPLPSARSHIGGATFTIGGRIIVVGGETSYNVSTDEVVAYNPSTNAWTQLTHFPVATNSGSAAAIDGVIYHASGLFRADTWKGVPSGTGGGGGTVVDVRVNFQNDAAAVPAGYVRDFGEAYGARTGADQGTGLSYGWVAPGTTTPRNLVGTGRERNLVGEQLVDTLVHMQAGLSGSWELAVPNGRYAVSVGVGDPAAFFDSVHAVTAENVPLITSFVPTSTTRFAVATALVDVADGRLTLDAVGGTNTKIDYVTVLTAPAGRPYVTATTPAARATNVVRNTPVTAEVRLPNPGFGIDADTLTSSSVRLVRLHDGVQVPARLNTSGGGDVIVLQPEQLLESDTVYRFEITSGVRDLSGSAFLPYQTSFTTGSSGGGTSSSPVAFSRVDLPNATGKMFTSLTFGPDGNLYAGTLDGLIYRFPLAADGTLASPDVIDSIQRANGGPRMLIGLAFSPASTAANPVLWVTHSQFAFNGGDDWTGKVTRLTGTNLGTVQDFVVGLPRSIRDHVTNSLAFGPDGKIYVLQGSNTASGAPDDAWGNRPERLLNAALLRIDQAAIASPPIDVKTEDGGTYDPFAAGAPVTIYASGIRNAYDLLWHSNGRLYVPANGSAANGNTPATPSPLPASCSTRIDQATRGPYTGPTVPGITALPVAQSDFLFRIVQGGYYGHPNPARCEWVLNGGNPTSAVNPGEVAAYPVGTEPDRNYRGFAYEFGQHYSPDGIIEYQSNAFGGYLRGKLLVVRYSAGDDIVALTPGGSTLDITDAEGGFVGLSGFADPLDLVEDPSGNGNIYISELAGERITLLRPAARPKLELHNLDGVPYDDRLVFSRIGTLANPPATIVHDRVTLRVKNAGESTLTVTGLPIVGPWQLVSPPTLPATLAPGGSLDLQVRFIAESGRVTKGTLTIQSNDAATPNKVVDLAGYWQSVPEGGVEPTLAEVIELYGWQTAITFAGQTLNQEGLVRAVGDEVLVPYWTRADTTQPVSVRQLGAFHSQGQRATLYWFNKYFGGSVTKIFAHDPSWSQTIIPFIDGGGGPAMGTFVPGDRFGFRIDAQEWSDPTGNDKTPDVAAGCPGPCGHHVRVWKLRDRNGAVVPNTYLMSMDYAGINYDYQDNTYLISNIKPSTNGALRHRLDVGGSANYTDTIGNVWTPDTGLFTPSDAPSEGGSYTNQAIAHTEDDPLYRTYRALIPGNPPLSARVLTYNLPVPNTSQVNIYLHFAERFWTANGQRLFNIDVEGRRVSTSLDLFKYGPGQDSAFVVAVYRQSVVDGTLNIAFSAVADFAAINAIEVYVDP